MPSTFAKPVNNFATTLAAPHSSADGQLVLTSASALGSLPSGRIFRVSVLQNPDTSSEVVLGIFEASGVSGNTLTGVTAAEGFSDVNLASGTTIQLRWTAKDASEIQAAINDLETTYVFQQMTAASTWTITHNLDRYPSVTIVDSGGDQVFGDLVYTSANQLTLSFSAAFGAIAYLN